MKLVHTKTALEALSDIPVGVSKETAFRSVDRAVQRMRSFGDEREAGCAWTRCRKDSSSNDSAEKKSKSRESRWPNWIASPVPPAR
jgi:hypothetical protein